MNIVVAALITGIDAAVSQAQQVQHQQFQPQFQPQAIRVNKMDSDTASSKQEGCDEISNKMKSMLIKICWTKDFIEKNIQDTQPAEAVGATKCWQNSATRRAGV